MPSRDDALDLDFKAALRDILGVDEDDVVERIEELSTDDLLDLADAVTRDDHEKVERIFGAPRKDKEKRAVTTKQGERARKDSTEQDESAETHTAFSVGDKVTVGDKKGTVQVPNGPGNTVGVTIAGKLKMVDRDRVQRLDEMVLGMTSLPDIARMRQLAGLPELSPEPSVVEVPPADETCPTTETPEACCTAAHAAIDALCAALPGVTLADLKDIRKRLNDVQMKLNESAQPKPGRQKV